MSRDEWKQEHYSPKIWNNESSAHWQTYNCKYLHLKKKDESQLSNLTLDINELEKEEKDKQQLRGNNDIIRVLINNTECRNTIESTKLEVGFFEKITELISFR